MPQPTAVNPVTEDVLRSKRAEYVQKRTLYQNTVTALDGAIEAIDDLLNLYEDGMTLDELKNGLGAAGMEIVENES